MVIMLLKDEKTLSGIYIKFIKKNLINMHKLSGVPKIARRHTSKSENTEENNSSINVTVQVWWSWNAKIRNIWIYNVFNSNNKFLKQKEFLKYIVHILFSFHSFTVTLLA